MVPVSYEGNRDESTRAGQVRAKEWKELRGAKSEGRLEEEEARNERSECEARGDSRCFVTARVNPASSGPLLPDCDSRGSHPRGSTRVLLYQ